MSQTVYPIRQLTKKLSITSRTLRYYEDERLVTPKRKGQNRLYSFADYARLLIVLRGRRLGYPITEMREVLKMYDFKDSENEHEMLMARKKFVERIAELRSKQRDIEESVEQLSECIRQIEGALKGQPRAPWYDFFARKPFAMPDASLCRGPDNGAGQGAAVAE